MTSRASLVSALITQAVMVLISLAVAFGLSLTPEQIAAIAGAAGFMGILATLVLWAYTVPREKVLEVLIGDTVVAGEANDQVLSGTDIRQVEPKRAATDPNA